MILKDSNGAEFELVALGEHIKKGVVAASYPGTTLFYALKPIALGRNCPHSPAHIEPIKEAKKYRVSKPHYFAPGSSDLGGAYVVSIQINNVDEPQAEALSKAIEETVELILTNTDKQFDFVEFPPTLLLNLINGAREAYHE